MGLRSIPTESPLVGILVIVAVGWLLASRMVGMIDPTRHSVAGKLVGWWRRQAKPVRSRLNVGMALLLFGVIGICVLGFAGADPLSGQVMLSIVALAFGLVQIVSGFLAAE